jgi:two-component system nitrogen regulation response regulator GlnG
LCIIDRARRAARFQQAHQGTLFLDQFGYRPAELQPRLLRVLADGEFYPVGGRNSIKVDVRIIAATHQNLESLVEKNLFREDLFHRLNVIRIHIPVLSERSQDIPLLMRHFLKKAAQELNTEVKILRPETEKLLVSLKWPGNVRQLENTCRWLTVMTSGREIHIDELPDEILINPNKEPVINSSWELTLEKQIKKQLQSGETEIAKHTIPAVESILIKAALSYTRGRRHEAANLLGYGRNTLTRKIKELELEP